MKTCDEFQLAIEMKRRGALDAASAAEAEHHVTTCATCQRELSAAAAMDTAMRAAPAPSLDFSTVSKALQRDRFWAKYLPWIAMGSFAGQGAIIGPLVAPENPLRLWAILAACGVVFAALTTWDVRRKARRTAEAARLGVEAWVQHRRARLDSELRDLKWMMAILPVIFVGMALSALFIDKAGARILLAVVAATVPLTMAYFWMAYRPKLLRERAELGNAS